MRHRADDRGNPTVTCVTGVGEAHVSLDTGIGTGHRHATRDSEVPREDSFARRRRQNRSRTRSPGDCPQINPQSGGRRCGTAAYRSLVGFHWANPPAYREFKPPVSRCATISPGREAVNHAVFGDNSLLARVCRSLRRPVRGDVGALRPPHSSAGRAGSSAPLKRGCAVAQKGIDDYDRPASVRQAAIALPTPTRSWRAASRRCRRSRG